ncbi:MAG: histone deacetylase [Acidobacteria bacterium]|nr:histone deacetylase [Acidobacteriota bacterium]MCA1611698.1 histone deacetylase [Acidobacteriota bacterium]
MSAATGILFDRRFQSHAAPYEHPERPARLGAIEARLAADGLTPRCRRVPAREATREELLAVHSAGHIDEIAATADRTYTSLDPDTYASAGSALAARLAAGGLVDLTLAVVRGELRNGLALIRPPGHHAEEDRAMGFCLFNSVAVAARAAQNKFAARAAQGDFAAEAAQSGIIAGASPSEIVAGAAQSATIAKSAPAAKAPRVLIVDWDVHHGNGTQNTFWEDAGVLYFSTHQWPFYPGTGAIGETGGVGARGRTVNVAWPAGRGDADHLAAFDEVLLPIAREFQPDFVLVSCGFDAARGDLLGQQLLSPGGYAAMTERLQSLAGGKVVLALEGGYALEVIAASAAACLGTLLGDAAREPEPGEPSAAARDVIAKVREAHTPYWGALQRR